MILSGNIVSASFSIAFEILKMTFTECDSKITSIVIFKVKKMSSN